MGRELLFIVKMVTLYIPIGFAAGMIFMGLMWLYNSLSAWARLPLKILTITPLVIMLATGLVASLILLPHMILGYVMLGAVGEGGRRLYFKSDDESGLKKTAGAGLMAAAVFPFIFAGFIFLGVGMGPQTYSFNIHNYSGHKIILKEAKVRGRAIFSGNHSLESSPRPIPTPLYDRKEWSTQISSDFMIKPGKIKLCIYDAKLDREIWAEAALPDYPKHPSCPFDIVYDQDGFHYDDRICG